MPSFQKDAAARSMKSISSLLAKHQLVPEAEGDVMGLSLIIELILEIVC
jgi:hypothetical protein